VLPVRPAKSAELLQLKPVRIVALVLRTGIVPVLALCAGQVDDYAVGFLRHFLFSEIRSQKSEPIKSDF
jgi:hypothetical protein